tara:strand:+ start:546 stop:905 length:360 start_codon:yes stop_codon:yes gene_type:complete
MPRGEEVKFEFSSADASTAAAGVLYNADAGVRTLAATQRFVVTSVALLTAVAQRYDVFSDNNDDDTVDAGERIIGGHFAAGIAHSLNTEIYCQLGITPKVLGAAAGQVDVIMTGYILNT